MSIYVDFLNKQGYIFIYILVVDVEWMVRLIWISLVNRLKRSFEMKLQLVWIYIDSILADFTYKY